MPQRPQRQCAAHENWSSLNGNRLTGRLTQGMTDGQELVLGLTLLFNAQGVLNQSAVGGVGIANGQEPTAVSGLPYRDSA
jgi:hypothetical protein